MNIHKALAVGTRGEQFVMETLLAAGIQASKNEDKETRSHNDLLCKINDKEFSIEVKLDVMAQKTNNLALEYFNCKSNKPSGIYGTKADIWAHVLVDGSNLTLWICNVKKLRKYIKDVPAFKMIKAAGDGNADLLLYKVDDILEATFIRLDNVSSDEIVKRVKECL